MASTPSNSTTIESIDTKKQNLDKVLENLQFQSSLLSSFTLQWKELEEHIDSIKKSIEERFDELESKEKASINGTKSLPPVKENPKEKSVFSESVVPRPEIRSFVSSMDSMGLRSYLTNHRKEISSIRNEVFSAIKLASDPVKLVLDGMLGFFPPNSKGDKDTELAATRRTCILLLECLKAISPEIKPQIKEKANKIAIEWKGELSGDEENHLEPLGLLQLVATFGLTSSFDANDLIDLVVSIAWRKQAIDICRSLGFADKLPDIIQKLIEKGKHLEAVRFAYAFKLFDMFPPVPLLKAHKSQAKKVANAVRVTEKQSPVLQDVAARKQISALKGIIKCIEDCKLESEYPRGSLDKHIEQLEKLISSKKRAQTGPTTGSNHNHQQQQQYSGNKRTTPAFVANQQHSGNKRPRGPVMTQTPSNPTTGLISPHQAEYYIPPTEAERYHHPSSFLRPGLNRVPTYQGGASSAHYGGLSVSAPNNTVPQYLSSSAGAGPYGPQVSSLNYGLNPTPSRSQLYSFEHHLSSASLYDRSTVGSVGGHVFPPNHGHPSYYP